MAAYRINVNLDCFCFEKSVKVNETTVWNVEGGEIGDTVLFYITGLGLENVNKHSFLKFDDTKGFIYCLGKIINKNPESETIKKDKLLIIDERTLNNFIEAKNLVEIKYLKTPDEDTVNKKRISSPFMIELGKGSPIREVEEDVIKYKDFINKQ